MKFDDILVRFGEFGFYQRRLCLMMCIPAISLGCYMMMVVYTMYTPDHRCKIPGLDNDTFQVQNDWHRRLINQSIPKNPNSIQVYERCYLIQYKSNTSSQIKCTEWVYDTTVFDETFASKLNLVCDDSLKTSHGQMIFYFGSLAGDMVFGFLSDVIGRKKVLVISAVLQLAAAVAVAFVSDYYLFITLNFLVGAACHAVFATAYFLCMEFTGPSKRVLTGTIIPMFIPVGLIYLAGVGALVHHWQYLQLAVSVPFIVLVFYWWVIPESPRWLLTQGRLTEADDITHEVAKKNKVKVQGSLVVGETIEISPKGERIWHMYKHKVLLVRGLILFFNWIVISMDYYGVTMHIGNLGGNFYLNQFILAAVEFPATIITMLLLNRIGRRKLQTLIMLIGGAALLCTIFPVLYGKEELSVLTLILSFIGKMGSSAAYAVIFIYTAELYPTVVRNGAIGISSCISRFGGMAAPYISSTGQYVTGKFGLALPLVIFGAASITAGGMTIMLPETLHRKLPETIRDGIEFGKKKNDMIMDGVKKEVTPPQTVKMEETKSYGDIYKGEKL